MIRDRNWDKYLVVVVVFFFRGLHKRDKCEINYSSYPIGMSSLPCRLIQKKKAPRGSLFQDTRKKNVIKE